MIQEGKLDKHGKPNSNTPLDYLQSYKDFSKTKAPELVGADADSKPAAAVEAMVVEETVVAEAAVVVWIRSEKLMTMRRMKLHVKRKRRRRKRRRTKRRKRKKRSKCVVVDHDGWEANVNVKKEGWLYR